MLGEPCALFALERKQLLFRLLLNHGVVRRMRVHNASSLCSLAACRYAPGVMGMSMDQSANLMWRLLNGQIPKKNKVGGRLGWGPLAGV